MVIVASALRFFDLSQGGHQDGAAHLRARENFAWIFESSDELNAGRWSFEVTLFSAAAPSEYPFRGTLEPMEALASLRQEFVVELT